MNRFLAAACLVGVLPFVCPADDDEGVPELQGTWRAVSITVGGQSPTLHPENYAIIFKGDHFTFQDAGKVTGEGTYTVDASVMPKQIDLRPQVFAANKGSSNELLIYKKVNEAKR